MINENIKIKNKLIFWTLLLKYRLKVMQNLSSRLEQARKNAQLTRDEVVQLASQTCLPKNGKYKVEVATNLDTYTYDLEIQ